MARGHATGRRQLGRHRGQQGQPLDHAPLLGGTQCGCRRPHGGRSRAGCRVDSRSGRQPRCRCNRCGAGCHLRPRPHVQRADPHAHRPLRSLRRSKSVRDMAGDPAVAVRTGGVAAGVVSPGRHAGGELRPSRAHRHRSGAACGRDVMGRAHTPSRCSPRANAPHARRHPTRERRLSRGDAADVIRDDESGWHGARHAHGGPQGRGFSDAVAAVRRLVADRHEPRHLGDDAVGGGAGRRRQAGRASRAA